jgi:hypothetical protein
VAQRQAGAADVLAQRRFAHQGAHAFAGSGPFGVAQSGAQALVQHLLAEDADPAGQQRKIRAEQQALPGRLADRWRGRIAAQPVQLFDVAAIRARQVGQAFHRFLISCRPRHIAA